jgi:hypothetical protein
MKRVTAGLTLSLALVAIGGPASAFTQKPYFVPAEGDDSLRSRCRSEASMIGGRGGPGATQRGPAVREMRRQYRKDCMRRGRA